jgi:hypothetical protein
MGNELAIDLNQNVENQLSAIADVERKRLITRNDYAAQAQIYSVNSPDAIADGDELGRGTGVFLDVYNTAAGTNTDVVERKNEIKINKFNSSKPYPNFAL